MALVDDVEGGFEEEFDLDLRVIEASYPIAKLLCDTSDGCGSTCSGSACNSNANNPS
ncbi:MAG: FxLD family lanthipeptide [Pseudonocardiaceae bacterium]